MTNEQAEKELKEFLEKSAEEYQDQFAHDEAIYDSFVNGANWMRRNLSLLPEVRELSKAINNLLASHTTLGVKAEDIKHIVSIKYLTELLEALKKLEGKK